MNILFLILLSCSWYSWADVSQEKDVSGNSKGQDAFAVSPGEINPKKDPKQEQTEEGEEGKDLLQTSELIPIGPYDRNGRYRPPKTSVSEAEKLWPKLSGEYWHSKLI